MLAILYVDRMRRIYAWARYILLAAVFSHLFAVANNTYRLILYFTPLLDTLSQTCITVALTRLV